MHRHAAHVLSHRQNVQRGGAYGALYRNQIDDVRDAMPIHAVQGDAEDLPFATDSFDRYVSAGSIGEAAASYARAPVLCVGGSAHLHVAAADAARPAVRASMRLNLCFCPVLPDSVLVCTAVEYWPEPQRGIR